MRKELYCNTMGATAACSIRLAEGTNQTPEASSVVMGDAWFGSVMCAAECKKRGMEAIFQIKSNHGLYPKQYITDALNDAPGGSHIVLTAKHPDEVELVAVGYRYNAKVTLFFVATKNAGSTNQGAPYEMKFADSHGNVHVRLVDQPNLISDFFKHQTASINIIKPDNMSSGLKRNGTHEIHSSV